MERWLQASHEISCIIQLWSGTFCDLGSNCIYRPSKQPKNCVFEAPHISLYCTQEAGSKSSIPDDILFSDTFTLCPNWPGTLNLLSHSAPEYWDCSHVTICSAQMVFLLLNQLQSHLETTSENWCWCLVDWDSALRSALPLILHNLGQATNLSNSHCSLGCERRDFHTNLAH